MSWAEELHNLLDFMKAGLNESPPMVSVSILLILITTWTGLAGRRSPKEESDAGLMDHALMSNVAALKDTSHHGVTVYYPAVDSIDLRCFDRPDPINDTSIIFCCAAAFTKRDSAHNSNHINIAGDHVSAGKRERGYPCQNNTGAFVFFDDDWHFLYKDYSNELDSAALHNGSGFAQEMLIHEGRAVETVRPLSQIEKYRALCEWNHKLCVIDADSSGSFRDFINAPLVIGVSEALYLDMGAWHYLWYRKIPRGEPVYIYPDFKDSATNWLIFVAK